MAVDGTRIEDMDVEEQRDRYRELLEELRTVLPGVQVLFGFLLVAPFGQRFGELDAVGRNGFAVAVVAAGVSAVCFLSPTSYHRVAPRSDRRRRLRLGVRFQLVGMAALLVAMTAALFVVGRFIYGTREGILIGAVTAVGGLLSWYALPLGRRVAAGTDEPDGTAATGGTAPADRSG
jgi:hypothetical protein